MYVHNPFDVRTGQFKKIACRYGLLITGVTDFQEIHKPDMDLGRGYGNLMLPYVMASSLKNIAGTKRYHRYSLSERPDVL